MGGTFLLEASTQTDVKAGRLKSRFEFELAYSASEGLIIGFGFKVSNYVDRLGRLFDWFRYFYSVALFAASLSKRSLSFALLVDEYLSGPQVPLQALCHHTRISCNHTIPLCICTEVVHYLQDPFFHKGGSVTKLFQLLKASS